MFAFTLDLDPDPPMSQTWIRIRLWLNPWIWIQIRLKWCGFSTLKNVLYLKARSLFNKLDSLSILLNDKQPDIVLITETWNNDSISNAILSVDGYHIEPDLRLDRQDTQNGIEGGVIVYIRNSLSVQPIKSNNSFHQYCKFKLQGDNINKDDDITFVLFHRSPNSDL